MKVLLEKHLNILDFALSTIWRRKQKNISIFVVFSAVIFLLASFQMLTRSLTSLAQDTLKETPEILVQKLSAGRQTGLPVVYSDGLTGIFGIKKVVPRIWGYYFSEVTGANLTVMGLDFSEMPMADQIDLTLEEGRYPEKGEAGVVVGRQVEEVLQLGGRTTISLFRPDLSLKGFTVTGRFADEASLLTGDLLVTGLKEARDLFALPRDQVTDLCVYVANPREISTIAAKISDIFPDTRVLTRSQILKTYQVVFNWRSGFGSICLLTALAAFIIMAWDKASGMSAEERKEMGILKVLGWETSDLMALRFWEGVVVSVLAFITGCTLAFIHIVFFQAALFRPVLLGWSVIQPPLQLLPEFSLADLLLIFSVTVLPYLAATVIPAWRCASVPSDTALQG